MSASSLVGEGCVDMSVDLLVGVACLLTAEVQVVHTASSCIDAGECLLEEHFTVHI